MTFFWLLHCPTLTFLQLLFYIHLRTAIKYLRQMVLALKEVLKDEICWPTNAEWTAHCEVFNQWLLLKTYPKMKNCVCVVDSSEFRMKRPSTEPHQSDIYSAKKKQHSLNVLFVVLLNGIIIRISNMSTHCS
jgi:hypothetical protein